MNEQIIAAAKKANGKRKDRTVSQSDMEIFENLINQHSADKEITTIRRYSGQGFVANAYKWRAEISVLQAARDAETGKFIISGFTVDAKRSHGNGALTTINGRAA